MSFFSSLQKTAQFPFHIFHLSSNRFAKCFYELKAFSQREINEEMIREWKDELKILSGSKPVNSMLPEEQELVRVIKNKTEKENINNVTRTEAYVSFYRNHPEIHWAMLAHLVSRNGGWNMTDLKGSLLTNILSAKVKSDFFMFLESANAFIFHDAYPQLLLYERSKTDQRNYFHLLQYFDVSIFMKPVWDSFLQEQDSQLLTISLIINEQQYIEKRLVQDDYFITNVFNSVFFEGQEMFHFTNVMFPYRSSAEKVGLIGLNVSHFAPVEKRIELGKRLYAMLFELPSVFRDVMRFVDAVPHTGSRADYWPHVFTAEKSGSQIYSPYLAEAWDTVNHTFIENIDWYNDENVFLHFSRVKRPKKFEITLEYYKSIGKIQAGASVLEKGKNLI
ncbi:DUF2515 family protein [Jeotgalibacillus soli]|uniref:DUF2515 domain-containing protein n=1 Tax=Jeotgalibacillus soli TaxID=889306 RepID=A0A0C2VUX4_9BACL|nr:DUF2515 family protein [Jeotgalibacillus soli]KIL48231.1 hypothetical protein KP78_16780 [Jeotgalibacillus soli]